MFLAFKVTKPYKEREDTKRKCCRDLNVRKKKRGLYLENLFYQLHITLEILALKEFKIWNYGGEHYFQYPSVNKLKDICMYFQNFNLDKISLLFLSSNE